MPKAYSRDLRERMVFAVSASSAARRQGDRLWAEAWREAPAVEQTLARLTYALSREQRTGHTGRVQLSPVSRGMPSRRLWASHAAAASCVALLAGIGGLAVAYDWQSDPTTSPTDPHAVVARQPAESSSVETGGANAAPVEETGTAEVERGKTVATTKLVVADASGEALHYIPLSISANASSGADRLAIMLTGLPRETVLTSGEDLGNGSWLLKPGEEQDLKLAVQIHAPREILIGVEAIDMKTGELAVPPQDLRVEVLPPKLLVQPVAVTIKPAVVPESQPPAVIPEFLPPEVVPAAKSPAVMAAAAPVPATKALNTVPEPPELPAPSDVHEGVPESDAKFAAIEPKVMAFVETSDVPARAVTGGAERGLIAKGDALMSMGEIIGARSFYNRAYASGDRDAARHIARTYDPVIYAELHVMGLKSDAEKALEWYRKAESVGVASAASDIAALEAFLANH